MSLYDWSNGGCVDVLLTSVVSLFGELLVLFKGMSEGFKNKIMLHHYRNLITGT